MICEHCLGEECELIRESESNAVYKCLDCGGLTVIVLETDQDEQLSNMEDEGRKYFWE